MQILHAFAGSIHEYNEQLADPDRHRPFECPQCDGRKPLIAHGFYSRTIVSQEYDGTVRVRRYLCRFCQRTVSLLPEFALPYVRFAITVLALFLKARLLDSHTLASAALAAGQPAMPYQRGQHWVRRFVGQAAALSAALVSLTRPVAAVDFVARATTMLENAGWILSHRFLFSKLRMHLLGWPRFLAPDGRVRTL